MGKPLSAWPAGLRAPQSSSRKLPSCQLAAGEMTRVDLKPEITKLSRVL